MLDGAAPCTTAALTAPPAEDVPTAVPGSRIAAMRATSVTILFQERPALSGLAMVGLGFAAVFDLTDLVMRARHMDPYGYDKGRVSDLTRKMREKMSASERPRRLEAALARLPGELEDLWR